MKKHLPELLAPAGTPEAAWAALAYGADAVYAGLPRFSARAKAGNFTAESLDELIGYARHLDRRVYITFNTLVQQRELDEALETLSLIQDLNASAVIVQDLGIARLVRKNFPNLPLHASTQLAVHNLDGAQQLATLGFKRVVLARELSLNSIEHITRNCGIETEVFIHGALCYSYSGLCLFSSHRLGRSGNRGRCAYCCRQPFYSNGDRTLPFSMKDFSAAEQLQELVSSGVASLKIEGRMKSSLYVAAVTDFYRKALEGRMENAAQQLADIQTIFGRTSTDLYLDNPETRPVDPVNDGHRGAQIGTVNAVTDKWLILHSNRALQKHDGLKVEMPSKNRPFGFAADEMRLASDPEFKRHFELPAASTIALKLPDDAPYLEAGAAVYCSYSQAVRQRYEFSAPRPGQFRQRRPIDIHVVQSLDETIFTATADGVQSELILPGPFEPARQPEKSAAAIQKCFEKLGDTDWKLNELTFAENSAPVFIPVSVLNDARRRLIAEFSKAEPSPTFLFHPLETFQNPPAQEFIFWSVKSRIFQALENIDEFVLEVDPTRPEEIEKALTFYAEKLRLALPIIVRDEDADAFKKLIEKFSKVRKWEAANVGGLHLLKGQTEITADWPLYTLNVQAALEWKDQGIEQVVLSPEDDAENIYSLIEQLGGAAIVPVYQHTPLMISATRPEADGSELMDHSRRKLRVEPAGREFVLTGETPFSITGHLDNLKARGAQHFRIDLCYGTDSQEDAADLVRRITSGQSVPGETGNFLRGLE